MELCLLLHGMYNVQQYFQVWAQDNILYICSSAVNIGCWSFFCKWILLLLGCYLFVRNIWICWILYNCFRPKWVVNHKYFNMTLLWKIVKTTVYFNYIAIPKLRLGLNISYLVVKILNLWPCKWNNDMRWFSLKFT